MKRRLKNQIEQHRRAAVAVPPSERRTRRLENVANRVELRVATSMPPSEAAAITSQLATPRGVDNNVPDARDPGSTSTLGMFSPAVSTGLDRRSTPTRRVLQRTTAAFITSACRRRIGSSSAHRLRREELIPDSMRKTTIANLETKTLKAFRNIFAHDKNAHAKISDWVSYIPVELHTQVRARIRSVVKPKTDMKRFTAEKVDNWQNMDILTVLNVLIEPNAAELVDGNSLVTALETSS
jgi:hypothetical protein